MGNAADRILIIENDPAISDLIGRQALQSLGYDVQIVEDATSAIAETLQFQPDILIIDLNQANLSGKDLLVALASQGVNSPVIALARKGEEANLVQAFRLGATDYLLVPARDAEVVAVVERALKQVHESRERENLARKLNQTNQDMQARVRELTAVFAIGKAFLFLADPQTLHERMMEAAIRVTNADLGWLLVRDEAGKGFILAAQRQLPASLAARAGLPWDDGVSLLVAISGETLSLYGEPLKNHKVSSLGRSVLIVPVKIQKQIVAILAVMRKAARPFTASEQALLEAAADYASISLANSRQYQALEDRARSLQQAADSAQNQKKTASETLHRVNQELRSSLDASYKYLDLLAEGQKGKITPEQRTILRAAQDRLRQGIGVLDRLENPVTTPSARNLTIFNVNNLARQALARFHRTARQNNLNLVSELSPEPVYVWADSTQVTQILNGLLANAVESSAAGGNINLRIEKTPENLAHIMVCDNGPVIEPQQLAHFFDRAPKDDPDSRPGGNIGICLADIKEMVISYGGKIWVENSSGKGSAVHFTLMPPKERI
ncbi:MAG: response regulator [Chloroflexi bacterium]|nr:response regulator [Chloroflexota bacterium]